MSAAGCAGGKKLQDRNIVQIERGYEKVDDKFVGAHRTTGE
jgi:hypothetical protein